MPAAELRRCAIYTRKSSDAGLEQGFNSLDAQREACEAFVKSQAHEGWRSLAEHYDDGGFSGASMQRPGLKKLLADIAAGKIDIVVVYKIDRLTRSLSDFARMVELFDKREVSFVSVTQAFNTTTSMGRLTLNVLLSFAQFEREVTGERIRDKIAASKAKGMWMGGNLPLGYDLPDEGTRILKINAAEADTVRLIFEKYLEFGSVHRLRDWLKEQSIGPKQWVSRNGKQKGGSVFSRGALFHLLRNPIYLGKIGHKGVLHDGGHEAITDCEQFDRVQLRLDHAANRWQGRRNAVARAPLAGRIFDAAGAPMSPSFSHGSRGQVYRYYVSSSLQKGVASSNDYIQRVPANAVEEQLAQTLRRLFPEQANILTLPERLEVHAHCIHVLLEAKSCIGIRPRLGKHEKVARDLASPQMLWLQLPLLIRSRRGRTAVWLSQARTSRYDQVLIDALRRAHALVELDRQRLPTLANSPETQYERRLIRLAFLAPDLQADILQGLQPAHLNLEQLVEQPLPTCWEAQRLLFKGVDCAKTSGDIDGVLVS